MDRGWRTNSAASDGSSRPTMPASPSFATLRLAPRVSDSPINCSARRLFLGRKSSGRNGANKCQFCEYHGPRRLFMRSLACARLLLTICTAHCLLGAEMLRSSDDAVFRTALLAALCATISSDACRNRCTPDDDWGSGCKSFDHFFSQISRKSAH